MWSGAGNHPAPRLVAHRRMIHLLGRSAQLVEPRDAERLPFTGHVPELGRAVVTELDARAGYEVLDGSRDNDLSGPRFSGHAWTDVHGNAPDLPVEELRLTGMQACAYIEAD